MSMSYKPINEQSYYQSLITDASRLPDFTFVWGTVSAIDLENYVNMYNSLEHSGNVTALNTLEADLNREITICENLRKTYSGQPEVALAAAEMKNKLQEVRNNTSSRVKYFTNGLGKFAVVQKVESALHKVVKVKNKVNNFGNTISNGYHKITDPGNRLYDKISSGSGQPMQGLMDQIDNIGRGRSR